MRAEVSENIIFDTDNSGVSSSFVVSVIPQVSVASGVAMTVGAGKTMIIDVLKIGGM